MDWPIDGDVVFSEPIIETAFRPNAVFHADFNNDGILDLATANLFDSTLQFGLGEAQFSEPVILSSNEANNILGGDFDNDGEVDLVLVENSIGRVGVFFGNGDGTFTPEFYDLPGSGPEEICLADFNNDGTMDIAVSCLASGEVKILSGETDGTFQIGPGIPVGDVPTVIRAADVNDDQIQDLVVSVFFNPNKSVAVLVGNGDATFQAPNLIASPGDFRNTDFAIEDLDGDNNVDILIGYNSDDAIVRFGNGDGTFVDNNVVTNIGTAFFLQPINLNDDDSIDMLYARQGQVFFAHGLGDGSFELIQTTTVGATPSRVQIADFDQDGQDELLVVNRSSDSISVREKLDDGTVESLLELDTGNGPTSAAVADFNQDGFVDIATSNLNSDDISVITGNGDGTFAPSVEYLAHGLMPCAVVAEDLNQDGFVDLATANQESNDISVLINNGAGGFLEALTFPAFAGLDGLAAGDVNGDAIPDLVAASNFNHIVVLPGIGNGTFGDFEIFLAGDEPRSIALGDINGDGILDAVTGNQLSRDATVLHGLGDGTFGRPVSNFVNNAVRGISLADFNNDGNLDVFAGGDSVSDRGSAILLGNANGSLQTATFSGNDQRVFGTGVGDFNNDGLTDLISVEVFENLLSMQFGAGDGTFGSTELFQIGHFPRAVAVGDFNSDGFDDIVTVNGISDNATILLNQIPNDLILGDINGDCEVNLLDVAGFVDLLSNGEFQLQADINQDGNVDLLDIGLFVDLLAG